MQLKTRTFISFFSALVILSTLITGSCVYLLTKEGLFRHKKTMGAIALQIDELIAPAQNLDNVTLKTQIKAGLRFTHKGYEVHYVISRPNQPTLSNSTTTTIPEEILAHKDKLEWKVIDYSQCYFQYLHQGKNGLVYLDATRHYELFHYSLQAIPLAIILVFFLALYSAWKSSQRIMKPIEEIAVGAAEIEKGNMGYRIPINESENAELTGLKTHLNDAFLRLEESFDRISNFSAEIAHEMRTPLTALLGNLEVSLRQPRSVKEYEIVLVETIEGLKKIHNLSEDMLLLVKPHQIFEKQFIPMDCSDMTKDIVEQMSILAESRQILLKSHISEGISFSGIPSLFQRILFNLISNAIKFTPIDGTISVTLTRQSGVITLEVSDTGHGISKVDFDHIFERFYRGSQPRGEGNGLGLTLCKWIIELHHGHISVNSTLGEGTAFLVTWKPSCPVK